MLSRTESHVALNIGNRRERQGDLTDRNPRLKKRIQQSPDNKKRIDRLVGTIPKLLKSHKTGSTVAAFQNNVICILKTIKPIWAIIFLKKLITVYMEKHHFSCDDVRQNLKLLENFKGLTDERLLAFIKDPFVDREGHFHMRTFLDLAEKFVATLLNEDMFDLPFIYKNLSEVENRGYSVFDHDIVVKAYVQALLFFKSTEAQYEVLLTCLYAIFSDLDEGLTLVKSFNLLDDGELLDLRLEMQELEP